ncbi:beta strand repeat-containing protein [Roseovarius aestuariivivens]|uniref:beta strand repeat-containing protein n=1 Tax=Roseovarius aestuariivivens TaxID=1888910 RepID=UPI001080931F|nr:calcium-binding protein [Roseovarius aestuariivivens]
MPLTPEFWLPKFTANITTTAAQFEPRITQLTNGNILVAWTSTDDTGVGAAPGTDIIGQLYDAYGTAIGSETRLNSGFISDNERNFDIAALDNGGFVVVYEDENGSSVNQALIASEWTTTSTGFGTATDRTIATSPDAGDIVRTPTVTSASDGSYTVGYEQFDSSMSENNLLFVNVDASGTVGTVQTAIPGSGSASSEVDSARLTNGDVVFVYDLDLAGADAAIAYSVRNPVTGATPAGAAFVANTDSNGDTDLSASVVALTGGGFVIAWQNTDAADTDIEMQRFDNSGVAQGSIINVDIGNSTDINTEVELVALADGGWLVLWDDDETGGLAGRGERYSATGALVGSQFVFDSANADHTEAVLLDDGRVALVWNDGEIHSAILDTRDNANTVLGPSGLQTGTIGDDVFTADSSATVVNAWDGIDTVTANGTSKEYRLGEGDDRMNVVSVIDADSYNGGGGTDTIDWSLVGQAGGIFDLAGGTATDGFGVVEEMTEFENLIGTDNSDVVVGTVGANSLEGGNGNDTLFGDAGQDTILGGNDNDLIEGGDGPDLLDGGLGVNTLSYESSTFAVEVNLQTGFAGFGDAAGDTISNFDNLVGSEEADLLAGDSGNNSIEGLGGNDTLRGGLGDDTLDGGAGDDLVSYSDATGSVVIVLKSIPLASSVSGADGNDTLLNVENVEGSGFGDFITKDTGSGQVFGGAGNDLLTGRGTSILTSLLDGGAGNDTIAMQDGQFIGNVDGGTEIDTFDLSAKTDFGLDVNLQTEQHFHIKTGFQDLSDLLNFENVIGTQLDDRIHANRFDANVIDGGAGNDTLSLDEFSAAGNNTLRGGANDDEIVVPGFLGDELDGGDGTDTLVVRESAALGSSVTIDLSGEEVRVSGSFIGQVLNFENYRHDATGSSNEDVIGNALGNRIEILGSGDNSIQGLGGDDTLLAGGGDDTLEGGANNDTLDGGEGADRMVGGTGDDTYFVDNAGDTIVENGNEGTDHVNASISVALKDFSQALETLTLTGSADIDGTGNFAANTITGNSGNNVLNGAFGNDTLIGGAGNDTFQDTAGADRMVGGTGDDTYFVDNAGDTIVENGNEGTDHVNASISVALKDFSQALEMLTLTGAADIDGTGNFAANTITGNSGNNVLNGAFGNDTLIGGAGNDTFQDTAGADHMDGGTGADVFFAGNGSDHMVAGLDADIDRFVFSDIADSAVGAQRDSIEQFVRGDDLVDLRQIDANTAVASDQPFVFAVGPANNSIWVQAGGSGLSVFGDVNGDATADFEIFLDGQASMNAADFLL